MREQHAPLIIILGKWAHALGYLHQIPHDIMLFTWQEIASIFFSFFHIQSLFFIFILSLRGKWNHWPPHDLHFFILFEGTWAWVFFLSLGFKLAWVCFSGSAAFGLLLLDWACYFRGCLGLGHVWLLLLLFHLTELSFLCWTSHGTKSHMPLLNSPIKLHKSQIRIFIITSSSIQCPSMHLYVFSFLFVDAWNENALHLILRRVR